MTPILLAFPPEQPSDEAAEKARRVALLDFQRMKYKRPFLLVRRLVQIAVGTFNLNNLFSRFDFRADVSTATASTVKVEERTSFSFEDPSGFKLRATCLSSRPLPLRRSSTSSSDSPSRRRHGPGRRIHRRPRPLGRSASSPRGSGQRSSLWGRLTLSR
jgi:hypothetical protein